MRTRLIKPGFFSNPDLAELPALTRILFQGLWLLADKEGRLWDKPKQIKARVLPFDNCAVDKMLSSLKDAGFIDRYTSDQKKCIQIRNFGKHQNITTWEDKKTVSEVPPPVSEKNFISETLEETKSDISTTSGLHVHTDTDKNKNTNTPLTPQSDSKPRNVWAEGLKFLIKFGMREGEARAFASKQTAIYPAETLLLVYDNPPESPPVSIVDWLRNELSKYQTLAERTQANLATKKEKYGTDQAKPAESSNRAPKRDYTKFAKLGRSSG